MWLKTALMALAPLAVTLDATEAPASAKMRYLMEFEVPSERVKLPSNTPEKVNHELRQLGELQKIIGNGDARAIPAPDGFAALVNGDKTQFTLWLRFPNADYPKKDEIASKLVDYVSLRWRGISPLRAIEIVRARAQPEEGPANLVKRLASIAPWLPFRELRPVKKGEVASIWWAAEPHYESYLFLDPDIAYLVQFDAQGGSILIALDPLEFSKEAQPQFAAAAKKARVRPKSTLDASADGPPAYWSRLQKELLAKGVKWKTPEELNPLHGW